MDILRFSNCFSDSIQSIKITFLVRKLQCWFSNFVLFLHRDLFIKIRLIRLWFMRLLSLWNRTNLVLLVVVYIIYYVCNFVNYLRMPASVLWHHLLLLFCSCFSWKISWYKCIIYWCFGENVHLLSLNRPLWSGNTLCRMTDFRPFYDLILMFSFFANLIHRLSWVWDLWLYFQCVFRNFLISTEKKGCCCWFCRCCWWRWSC